ncbi:MAG TPA: Pr6Pr family membrane protein [Pseudonocardia sp.]
MLSAQRPVARAFFALGAATVVVALAIQIPITAAARDGFFNTPGARVANLFAFFTILSNVLVGVTDAVFAARPRSRSTLLSVARFDAVSAITVTGVVYHLLLAGRYHLHGAEEFANQLFHTVTPLLTVAGWLLFGPRRLVGRRVVALSLLYPVAWLVFTLVRGAIIGWYPYPFLDVDELGYARVALTCAAITLLFLGLAACYAAIDRVLARRAAEHRAPPGAKIQA